MTSEFLRRAHSKRLGELDESNWKNLESKRNIASVDPAIREIVSLLNDKGYKTFSSCSGGHRTNLRKKIDRHEDGYIAFSPPSRVAFTLYLALRGKNNDFTFEAGAILRDGNGNRGETLFTQLDWQLRDQRRSKLQYYRKLFAEMKRIVELLPSAQVDHKEVLTGLLGRERLSVGLRVVRKQMKCFSSR